MELDKIIISNELLNKKQFDTLKEYADKLQFNNLSLVYNKNTGESKIKESIRKSSTVIVKDVDFVQNVILRIMEKRNQGLRLKIARNYITFIRYEEGGFFEWHIDFEQINIKGPSIYKEMHLLFCIEAPKQGGALSIKIEEDVKTIEMEEGLCIIFDKTLEHRGELVEVGTKIIMTVDVLVTLEINEMNFLKTNEQKLLEKFQNTQCPVFECGCNWEVIQMLYEEFEEIKKIDIVPFLDINVSIDTTSSNIEDIVLETHIQFIPNGVSYIRIDGDFGELFFVNGKWYGVKKDYSKYSYKYCCKCQTVRCVCGEETFPLETDSIISIVKKWQISKNRDPVDLILNLTNVHFSEKNIDVLSCFPDIKIPLTEDSLVKNVSNIIPISERIKPKTNVLGYNYWCNQTEYSKIDIEYKYGLVHISKLGSFKPINVILVK